MGRSRSRCPRKRQRLLAHSPEELLKLGAAWQERAAIMEFDGGLDREDAERLPWDDVLGAMPFVHNAYIAGLAGIVGLAELAGRPDASAKAELNRLLALRVANFAKDRPAFDKKYDGVFNVGGGIAVPLTVSRSFMFLVPEAADYLRANALDKVKEAVRHYSDEVLPYWFVSKAEQGDGENTFSVLFDYHALLQAKAMILKEPYEELVKHLDVPAFYRGDLYYIDNLCAALEATNR